MTLVGQFGFERTCHNEPDASSIAETIFEEMIALSRRFEVDPADIAVLTAVDMLSSLAAYGRASTAIVMAVINDVVPVRAAILDEANRRGEPRPPLSIAKLQALVSPGVCRLH